MTHNYRDGGKGDKPRPMPNKEQFDANFEAIFGKRKKATVEEVDYGVYIVEVKDVKDEL
jgi:hypothetical protein